MQIEVAPGREHAGINRLSRPARVLGVLVSALAGVIDGRVRTPAPALRPSGHPIATDDPSPAAHLA